jgi:hypothetical protein
MSDEFEKTLGALERSELEEILSLLHNAGGEAAQKIELLTLYMAMDSDGRDELWTFIENLTV